MEEPEVRRSFLRSLHFLHYWHAMLFLYHATNRKFMLVSVVKLLTETVIYSFEICQPIRFSQVMLLSSSMLHLTDYFLHFKQ